MEAFLLQGFFLQMGAAATDSSGGGALQPFAWTTGIGRRSIRSSCWWSVKRS